MKRDKAWLINELLDVEVDGYDNYYNGGYEDGLAYALKLAHQLDEPEKVVIPKFVADEIEFHKFDKDPLPSAFENVNLDDWLYGNMARNVDVLARAWLDGYEVEKEKLYYIKFSENQYAQRFDESKIDSILASDKAIAGRFTEQEIKKMNPKFMALAVEVVGMNLPEWAKYVARDADGQLYTYEIKPTKESRVWLYEGKCIWLPMELFPDVKWSDEEPTEIGQVLMHKGKVTE